MDRVEWLAERRAAVKAQYDSEAPDYDDNLTPHDLPQRVRRPSARDLSARRCRAGRAVRHRAVLRPGPGCGSARRRHRPISRDARAGSIEGLAERLENVGLQEMSFTGEFDGSLTIDAMENVSPEDWPVVLANLHRAVKPADTCTSPSKRFPTPISTQRSPTASRRVSPRSR